MGENLKGKDKRILALLYALIFYGIPDQDLSESNLEKDDVDLIKKAHDYFGNVFKRFIKRNYGWKAGSNSAFGLIYGLSVLRENIKIGFH